MRSGPAQSAKPGNATRKPLLARGLRGRLQPTRTFSAVPQYLSLVLCYNITYSTKNASMRPQLGFLVAVWAAAATGHDVQHRNTPSPHVHGTAELQIVLEETGATAQLRIAGMSAVGFERAPRSEAERARLDRFRSAIVGAGWLVFPRRPAASCPAAMCWRLVLRKRRRTQKRTTSTQRFVQRCVTDAPTAAVCPNFR